MREGGRQEGRNFVLSGNTWERLNAIRKALVQRDRLKLQEGAIYGKVTKEA